MTDECSHALVRDPYSTFVVTLLGTLTLVLKPSKFISDVVAGSCIRGSIAEQAR